MNVKVSTQVDEHTWEEVKHLSQETHVSLSHLVTEALQDLLFKKRVRPEFLRHLEDSIRENEKLGHLLAQ